MDGRSVHQKGEQDPGQAGVVDANMFIRLLSGFPVSVEKVSGSKELRADPFSSQLNAGNVCLVRGKWNKGYIEELRQFPQGKHDDRIDATSVAFNKLERPQSRVRTLRI